MSIMQQLYDSEINAAVSTFWDGGFKVALGDDMNGWLEEAYQPTWDDVEAWLADAAVRHFPNSDFAKKRSAAP